jgi:hypothetical protein
MASSCSSGTVFVLSSLDASQSAKIEQLGIIMHVLKLA